METQARWIICPCCQGEGARNMMGLVHRDDWEGEDWEQYLGGGYDSTCRDCQGSGKMLSEDEPTIMRTGSDGQAVCYRDADEASEHRLRMAEGWV